VLNSFRANRSCNPISTSSRLKPSVDYICELTSWYRYVSEIKVRNQKQRVVGYKAELHKFISNSLTLLTIFDIETSNSSNTLNLNDNLYLDISCHFPLHFLCSLPALALSRRLSSLPNLQVALLSTNQFGTSLLNEEILHLIPFLPTFV
jgi:hypothetical protein